MVRASGRELSYVLLSGIMLCYLVSFLFVIRPTDIVCGVQQTAIGLCFSVVYAALFTKTNRIARIFKTGKKSVNKPSFISPKSQLVICGGLVTIQGITTRSFILRDRYCLILLEHEVADGNVYENETCEFEPLRLACFRCFPFVSLAMLQKLCLFLVFRFLRNIFNFHLLGFVF